MAPTAADADAGSTSSCANTEGYEFCNTPECDDTAYLDITCLPACDGNLRDAACVHPEEVIDVSSRYQTVNIATSIWQEYMAMGSNKTLPDGSWHIVRDTALYNLIAWFEVTMPSTYFMSSHKLDISNITLVLLSPNGEVYDVRERAGVLILSHEDMSAMLGDEDLFDSVAFPEDNMVENATHSEGPFVRLTGLDLDVKLHFANMDGRTYIPSSALTCFISLSTSWVPYPYFERIFTSPVLGIARRRTYYSLHFEIKTSQRIAYVDLMQIYLFCVTALVVLGLPRKIMTFVATRCLGGLSRIYNREVNEPFDILHEIAAAPMRIMDAQATYSHNVDMAGGISEARLEDVFMTALASHRGTLDNAEVANLTHVCFQRICAQGLAGMVEHDAGPDVHRLLAKALARNTHVHEPTPDLVPPSCISSDVYVHALLFGNRLQMCDIVQLFDCDRRLSLLESLFLPHGLRSLGKSNESETVPVVPAGAPCVEEVADVDGARQQIDAAERVLESASGAAAELAGLREAVQAMCEREVSRDARIAQVEAEVRELRALQLCEAAPAADPITVASNLGAWLPLPDAGVVKLPHMDSSDRCIDVSVRGGGRFGARAVTSGAAALAGNGRFAASSGPFGDGGDGGDSGGIQFQHPDALHLMYNELGDLRRLLTGGKEAVNVGDRTGTRSSSVPGATHSEAAHDKQCVRMEV
eukprot:NODE_2066_length_2301_cov_9.732291.p1 GENE.NODE_2066_length_2301_cov_9.732291~~NODE_2066_length_2301_cov_9.732291.p1  ORF type:complete len:707 (+),score=162.98 NODE_2066_length_2301_cov_9.732291:27-2123(+)